MKDYKDLFPIFKNLPHLVYLDSGATTLKPQVVLDKMMEYYTQYGANIHRGLYPISERATTEYEAAREKIRLFVGAGVGDGVIFTSGVTASLNLVARGWGEANLESGEEIVVTEMEHHSNLVPWQELAKRKNLILKYLSVEEGQLQTGGVITRKTKLLAITQVSNVLGTVNPIKEIVRQAREISPDICVVVDGAQAVAHHKVNLAELGVDFYGFSGHKMYGPTGVGVLWVSGRRLGQLQPVNFGGGMIKEVTMEAASFAESIERYEAGTPPIAEVIALGAAVELLEEIGVENIERRDNELSKYLLERLENIQWVKVMGSGENGVVSIVVEGIHAHDVAEILGRDEVCVRAGVHCAIPLHQKLGVEATTRISFGLYNGVEDIDKLVSSLNKLWTIFTKR